MTPRRHTMKDTDIREARVNAAMRSGMPELAAQQLADRLEAPDDLTEALDCIEVLIDWFGVPDWTGPALPEDLGRRIAHLLERTGRAFPYGTHRLEASQ